MSKKRKSVATRLDEEDRSMYTTFCSAANSLSQLYSQAMNQQRFSFQDGERHALEKLFQWILRQQEEGTRVTTADITAYLQNELQHGAEESPMSPRLSFQQQHPQTAANPDSLSVPFSTNPISPATIAYQAKNSFSLDALSSLQHYNLVQGAYHSNNVVPSANVPRNIDTNYTHLQNREVNSPSAIDCMDVHADSPDHYFPF